MFKDQSECFFVNVIDQMIEEASPTFLSNDPLRNSFSCGGFEIFWLREYNRWDELNSWFHSLSWIFLLGVHLWAPSTFG